ncbi:hypothetical protein OIV83_006490 [Microbotryomycetes sp. JL201]|nr:hypothetical protein OIV83_006490 [Microbotryomycetes sp. JL201]
MLRLVGNTSPTPPATPQLDASSLEEIRELAIDLPPPPQPAPAPRTPRKIWHHDVLDQQEIP